MAKEPPLFEQWTAFAQQARDLLPAFEQICEQIKSRLDGLDTLVGQYRDWRHGLWRDNADQGLGHDTREKLDKICELDGEFEKMCERLEEIAQDLNKLIKEDINTLLPRPGGKGSVKPYDLIR